MSFMFLEQPATGRIFRLNPATGYVWIWTKTKPWWRRLGDFAGPSLIAEHPVQTLEELPQRWLY